MKQFSFILLTGILLTACSTEVTSEPEEAPELNPDYYNVAFVIMDGTYNTELTAPFDIFHHTRFRKDVKAMNVFTVAKSMERVTTFEGIRVQPDFSYLAEDLPTIDILVVPSAEHHLDSDLEDEQLIQFIQEASTNAEYVMSHCDGAFVLAKAGLLDRKTSTTFPADIQAMRDMFPKANVLDSVLFVHDGKYITSAGGAKSFEASLYLCEILYGKQNADEIAEGMVIDWDLTTVPHVITSTNQ